MKSARHKGIPIVRVYLHKVLKKVKLDCYVRCQDNGPAKPNLDQLIHRHVNESR